MSRPVKIILIILSVGVGLYLIIGGLLTLVLGDRTVLDEEYRFVISNETDDTIFVEETDCLGFMSIEPKSEQIYRFDHVTGKKSEGEYKWPIKEKLVLIRKNDTSTILFNDKNAISITTDEYGNKIVTRTIK